MIVSLPDEVTVRKAERQSAVGSWGGSTEHHQQSQRVGLVGGWQPGKDTHTHGAQRSWVSPLLHHCAQGVFRQEPQHRAPVGSGTRCFSQALGPAELGRPTAFLQFSGQRQLETVSLTPVCWGIFHKSTRGFVPPDWKAVFLDGSLFMHEETWHWHSRSLFCSFLFGFILCFRNRAD